MLVVPAYWVLMSVAGWKGFIQLFTKPFYWEKTEHGLVDMHDYRGICWRRFHCEFASRTSRRGGSMTVAPAQHDRGADRRLGAERRDVIGPWSGRDRRSGLDRRKGERRRGFGRRAGALTVPRRFPESGPTAVTRPRVVVESGIVTFALVAVGMVLGLQLVADDVLITYATGSLASTWSLWHAPAGSALAFGYDEPPLLPLLEVPLTFDTALTADFTLLPAVSVVAGATLAGIVHAVLAGFRVRPGHASPPRR